MKACLMTIGDEILIGQIVDTNSVWMAQKLNDLGIAVFEMLSVSDTQEHIVSGLDRALAYADIVLITGGLGPTKDDITKNVLADYFGTALEFRADIYEQLTTFLQKRGVAVVDAIKNMAMLPQNCTIFPNQKGMAAAMWFEKDDKVVVSMPGVPYEMINFMETAILSQLQQRFQLPAIYHHTTITVGLGESIIAEKISPIEDSLPSYIKLAYLPSLGTVRLRLSARGSDYAFLQQTTNDIAQQIHDTLTEKYILGTGEDKLETVIGQLLLANNATMATAESCTGGQIAQKITSIAGASRYFKGGFVVYSNELKTQLLNVQDTTLKQHEAVSEATVIEMANNTIKNLHCDYAIAVSGIAGPDGGTAEKPVGTIWIAVANRQKTITQLLQTARPHRDINIELASNLALNQLRKLILGLL